MNRSLEALDTLISLRDTGDICRVSVFTHLDFATSRNLPYAKIIRRVRRARGWITYGKS